MMKKIIYLTLVLIMASSLVFAQTKEQKEKYKELSKEKYGILNTKKFWKSDLDWQMCKIALHFKNISTEKSFGERNKDDLGHFTIQSWAVLKGVSEETMQEITDEFTELFKKRLKEEAGIDVQTWEAIKDHPATEKMKSKAREDNILYNKRAGAAYTCTADNGPDYKKGSTFIPKGKKLAKKIDRNVAELNLVIDFGLFAQNMEVAIGNSYAKGSSLITPYTVKSGSKLIPIVHIEQGFGSFLGGEGTSSTFSGHDKKGYYTGWTPKSPSNVSDADYKIFSFENYAERVEDSDQIPQEIVDRFKVEASEYYMHVVHTRDELYKKAVMDALSKYLDDFIWIVKYNRCDYVDEKYCNDL